MSDTDVDDTTDSLRDDIEAAFAEERPDAAELPSDAAPAADPEPTAPNSEGDGRTRDDRGRFSRQGKNPGQENVPGQERTKAGDLGAAPAAVQGQPAAAQAPPSAGSPVPPPEVGRAPQAWKPGAREHWAALPPDVRAEVDRREREIGQSLQATAEARRTAQAFQDAVRPFEAMVRAEGSDPIKAVSSLLQTAAALRTGSAGYKAQLVAQIVQGYGVPVDLLDRALAGQAMPAGQQQGRAAPIQDPRLDRLDQLLAQVEQATQARQTELVRSQAEKVDQFGGDKEFFEDLRSDMADWVEVAARRGENIDLTEAYRRALAGRPDISKIVAQREAAAAAKQRTASVGRIRAAASSVPRAAPIPASLGEGKGSLREDLEEAMAAAADR